MALGDFQAAVSDLRMSVQLEPSRAPFQFAYAYALSRSGQTASARAAIAKCLKLDPNFPGAHRLAGEIESDRKNFVAAVEFFKKAHSQEPRNADVLNSLGLALASLGRFADAAIQFRAVTNLQPEFVPGHYNLGLALLNLENAPEAEKEFREALSLEPGYEKARLDLAKSLLVQGRDGNRDKTRDALEIYSQILQSNPHDVDSRFNLASSLSLSGDDQGALAEYQEVAQTSPDYPSVQFYLGYTEYKLKDYADAVNHLRKALDQGTNNFFVRYCLGSSLLQTGDRVAAKSHLEAAAKIDPTDPSPHFQLAKIYNALGKPELASGEYKTFRELTQRHEMNWHVKVLEKQAAVALRKGETTQGIDGLKEVYTARHDISSARNLGLAYLKSGKLAEAKRYLEEALKLSPQDAATHNYLGLLEAQQGNLAQAQKEFETAANLDPSFPDALYNAGVSSYELRQIDVAIKYFRAALSQSDSAELHRAMALALADAGKPDEAQQHLDEARKVR